jgi:hypothetical protein
MFDNKVNLIIALGSFHVVHRPLGLAGQLPSYI